MDPRIERINNAVDFVRERIGGRVPQVGIVLGSGLGKLAEKISDKTVIPYREIPGFPVGHRSQGKFHHGYARRQNRDSDAGALPLL